MADNTKPDNDLNTEVEPEEERYPVTNSRPVFFDPNRRRWPIFLRGVRVGAFLLSLGLLLLIVSVFARPLMPPLHLPKVVLDRDFGVREPNLSFHDKRQQEYVRAKTVQKQQETIARDTALLRDEDRRREAKRRETLQKTISALQTLAGGAGATDKPSFAPIVAGFYVNWEETAFTSAQANMGRLTHFIPEWLSLKPGVVDYTKAGNVLGKRPFVLMWNNKDQSEVLPLAREHNVAVVPLLNNYTHPEGAESGKGNWDPQAVHWLVSNEKSRTQFITVLRQWLLDKKMQGINIDFEEVATQDRDNLTAFMQALANDFHAHGLIVTEDVELERGSFDLPALAEACDWLVPMFYDENAGGGDAGPVAGIDWTRHNLNALLNEVPPGKIVMGVGNHAYDWQQGHTDANDLMFQSAIDTARDNQEGLVTPIHLDKGDLNPTFTYLATISDGKGQEQEEKHTVWMQDAVSVYNQLALAKPKGIRGAALWFLGNEDPSLWSYYDKAKWNQDWSKIVDGGGLNTIAYTGTDQINFEGEGELLEPLSPPQIGLRTVTRDPKSGLITSETYQKNAETGKTAFPSSHVVRRYGGTEGNTEKKIVLTFDDGPDPQWTPEVLDILKQYKVPACFFVVGRNAEANPDLIRRIYDEGHEIGDHSWSHPDMANFPIWYQDMQLTTTQRIIQEVTGHSTVLFRPPYGNDVEPETGKEVSPLETASRLNYITVGQKIDPQDWRLFDLKPGSDSAEDKTKPRAWQDVVAWTMRDKDQGSIVLLHDAGGDRSNTIKALPEIIQQLRAQGYQFVSVADLRGGGVTRATLMPPVQGRDRVLVGANRYVFEVTYLFQRVMTTLFLLSIVLGISRVVIFVVLALIQRVRERYRVFPEGFAPSVSVIIAAYNEEKVVNATVAALLESNYPNLEVIVVDDGSKDNTAGVVREVYGDDPRVRVFRKENGGKATALNRGLQSATGDIVVSLDADTLFAPDTIHRLARHFVDPKVGAVSGNVRVGNTHNILTKWQSLEYTTSQNFDRRGYDLLNCITVVPGAVGALRRKAVLDVGGYTHDTLAEDTDLTWKLRRAGWHIVNDNTAMAYTEAPESLRALAKQRFRWAFGTLQCLVKHRNALFQNGAFGWIALPSLWLYQILFPAVSPFMDIGMVYSLFAGNFVQFAGYFLLMFAIEFAGAFLAIRMDRGNLKLLPWLFLQRFVYRQLMYYVILKSLIAAIRGGAVGWNKLERTGTARIDGQSPAQSG